MPAHGNQCASAEDGETDITASDLSMTVMGSTPTDIIDVVNILAFGNTQILTTGSVVRLSLSGSITVLEDLGGAIVPVVIPFSATFDPADELRYADYPDTTLWSAEAMVSVSAVVPDATKITLDFNLELYTSAGINYFAYANLGRKDGPGLQVNVNGEDQVSPAPLPSSFFLFGIGLAGLLHRCKRSRNQ